MKQVRVIKEVGYTDEETIFTADCMPMAIHFAEQWARRNGYELIKSPAKIAQLFPACHQVAVSKDEKVFYVTF